MFPGGQVENGENLIDALHRETMEESGIEIAVGRLFSIASHTCSYPGYGDYANETVPTMVIMGFVCTYLSGEFRASDETTEAQWVAKDQVFSMLKPQQAIRYQAYFEGGVQYLDYISRPQYQLKLKREI